MDQKLNVIDVFATHPELTEPLMSAIQGVLGQDYRVLDWQHSDSSIFHAVQVERNVMFLILTLIIVIASFNMISGLIMLVKDKTRDISILRTMGASRGMVLRIFFLTGSFIGIVGTLLGLVLGLSFAVNIESIRKFLETFLEKDLFSAEIYFLTKLPVHVDYNEIALIVGMSLILSFLSTLYPSWKASRLDPIEGIRS
jgi:lipoprotein-releasing system permease protein